ncbi:putative nuclease HARBI1 [Merluccius polli]|uniref:Nuclease HARBI1 n=1 Tax=Merluccius polli TaxID=89951 RepID=A0AA47MFB7_MERPO|nr:putative nuclease HARBI1 [Merluccius polli]
MACLFDNDPVDEVAALLRRELNIRREMVIRPRIDVLAFQDTYFFERYRFTSQSIIYIHNLIRPYICNITNRSHALTSHLSFSLDKNLSEPSRRSSTGLQVNDVGICSINFKLYSVNDIVLQPQTGIRFPSVIGCIDGTHIPITAPSHNEEYVNRKSIHIIHVQIIRDAAYIISNAEAKWPGSVHDARIYRESNLSKRVQPSS